MFVSIREQNHVYLWINSFHILIEIMKH